MTELFGLLLRSYDDHKRTFCDVTTESNPATFLGFGVSEANNSCLVPCRSTEVYLSFAFIFCVNALVCNGE